MIYPKNFEEKIDFDQIRLLIKENCLSAMGQQKVNAIVFSPDLNEIVRLQEETEEFRQILLFEPAFPAQDYIDLTQELTRLQLEGTFIETESLNDLKAVLKTIQACLLFFRIHAKEDKFPFLCALSSGISIDNQLIEQIEYLVDEKGRIRDNASPDLQNIRQKMHRLEIDIQKQMRKIIHQAKKDNIVESTAEVSVRDGRLVIPVPAAFKRKLKGLIHDESATGLTVFIEPQEIFETNNALRDLYLLEKREIVRILTAFTNDLRPQIPSILAASDYLATIDCIRAKAKFALLIQAVKPLIVDKPIIQWKKAKHPLLYLNFRKEKKEVVPLDIEIGNNYSILIVTGPNAGGKSVCLKTVGLLQYMFQCGLLVPVSELSEFGVFNQIYLDMGDEQSIENDLSTYSSHLKNMQAIVQALNHQALFLMDELGSGTDPQYGGAIAESFLEYVSKTNAKGLVTTHFGNLKALAAHNDKIENAAMLFDEEAMNPLFVLKIGKWGSSFTFEIARKIGFSKSILDHAMAKIGTHQINYEKLLQKTERQQIELDNKLRMLQAVDAQLKELIDKQKETDDAFKQQKYELLKKAKLEAKAIVDNANKIIENAVRNIRESKADKEVVKQIKEEVKQFKEKNEKILTPKPHPAPKLETPSSKIQINDYVIINDTNTIGQVSALDGDDIIVSFNSIQFKTTCDKVSKTHNKPKAVKSQTVQLSDNSIHNEINEKAQHFSLQLDIRGMRVDEATQALESYIDDAILLRIHEVRILHGKGNGILRSITRDILAKNKDIASFHDERLKLGGYGITVVKLK